MSSVPLSFDKLFCSENRYIPGNVVTYEHQSDFAKDFFFPPYIGMGKTTLSFEDSLYVFGNLLSFSVIIGILVYSFCVFFQGPGKFTAVNSPPIQVLVFCDAIPVSIKIKLHGGCRMIRRTTLALTDHMFKSEAF